MGTAAHQSVLAILVPEAEHLVAPFRLKYDPSAAEGMPAHITINYPFMPGQDVGVEVLQKLVRTSSSMARFEYSLIKTNRFPGVLYLEPSHRTLISELIEIVAREFPESPPYGGEFEEINPHLTIAHGWTESEVDDIADRFDAAAAGKLPIHSSVSEIWLVDNKSGKWTKRTSFPLAQS